MHKNKAKSNGLFLKILIFIIFSSFYFQTWSIYVGFHLKSFMILSLIVLSFIVIIRNGRVKIKITPFDMVFIFIIIYSSIPTIMSKYPADGLRMTLGFILIFFCYFSCKIFLENSRISYENTMFLFYSASMLFIYWSIISYVIGYVVIDGNYKIYEHVIHYGVLVERSSPRLVGPLSDPNIFSFYCIIILFYIFTKTNKNTFDKINLILTTTAVVLSLSRGGWLAITVAGSYWYFYNSLIQFKKLTFEKKLFKAIIVAILTFLGVFILLIENNSIRELLINRFKNISQGSGRSEIWVNAINIWQENPIFGIGLGNFRPYSDEMFNRAVHVHNTFLEILVELGLIGILLYCTWHLIIFITCIKLTKKNKKYQFLILSYIAMILMMNTISLTISEYFFLFLIILSFTRSNYDYQHLKTYKTTESNQ